MISRYMQKIASFYYSTEFNKVPVVYYLVLIVAIMAVIAMPDNALAQTSGSSGSSDGLTTALCAVISTLQGNVGRAVAAIAIIFLGLSLFLGKISWGVALALAIGIGAVFGASSLVSMLSGGDLTCP